MTTTSVLARRFLAEYARNPVNLLVLALIPVVFVVAAAGAMADAARLLGGSGADVPTATAGWAAAFLAGVAMYFQTRAARAADRRLVLAGLAPRNLVAARLATGLALSLLVTAAALVALSLRTGIEQPLRVTGGTLMFALIYLAIGTLVGVTVRNPVNGTVIILFVWILDVFFGPAVGSPDRLATRWFPTHFVTLWMVDLPSRHGGWPGDLGWALLWTASASLVAWTVLTATSRISRRRIHRQGRFVAGLRMGLRDNRRNPALLILMAVVPVVFIWFSKAVTEAGYLTMQVVDSGQTITRSFWLPDVHAGTMTPIAVASLAALAGLFIVLDARTGDSRLTLAGFPKNTLLVVRLCVVGLAAAVVTAAALTVTALVFDARQPVTYAAGNVLIAATYAMIGVCLGPVFGRVAGVLIAFLIPFLDLGIAQSPMLRSEPPGWARFLPGYGADRILLDGGLTAGFDQTAPLLLALAWLTVLTIGGTFLFRRAAN
ncbi:ABC transporter permease [Kribbella sp. NPDC050124]|uniref:ABC transporter permease n=1 Tax=Kribbella sp. NPDC050124 TaxID=3364114 RepID=UPI0037AAAD3E